MAPRFRLKMLMLMIAFVALGLGLWIGERRQGSVRGPDLWPAYILALVWSFFPSGPVARRTKTAATDPEGPGAAGGGSRR